MPTATAPIADWGTALITALSSALMVFFAAIPRVIGFLVILIIGWLIASVLAGVVASILRAVKFNDLAQRSGFSGFVQKAGMNTDASGAIATVAKWFVRLMVLTVAFDALGLPAVSAVLQEFIAWLPNLVVAIIALVIGGLAANALSSLVRGATAQAGFGNSNLLATIARVAVWAFAIVVAVNQIGIATTLINTLFMGVVGALALAAGLAFGLGGRDTAAEIVRGWYQSGQSAAPKVTRAMDTASDPALPQRTDTSSRPRPV